MQQKRSAFKDLRLLARLVFYSHVLLLFKNPLTLLGRLLSIIMAAVHSVILRRWLPYNANPPAVVERSGMDLDSWNRWLSSKLYYPPMMGTIDFLIDGQRFFSVLHEAIEKSQQSIDVRMYIFDNDDVATVVADQLKAQTNVRVRVLMDDLGYRFAALKPNPNTPESFESPDDIGDYMAAEGVQVRRSPNPWFSGDHNKAILIDGDTLFTGSINIGREYRHHWHDLMMQVKGPVISIYEKQFDKAWAHAGPSGDLGHLLAFCKPLRKNIAKPEGAFPIHVLSTSTAKAEIHKVSLGAIKRAQSYIFLENPYFRDNRLIDAIIAARYRGVDVRIIFPGVNDIQIMAKSNELLVNRFLEHGVRVFIYPGMTHLKAIMVDDWASVGSANYDMLSLYVNQESNLAFSDPTTIAKMKQDLFEKDFEKSVEVTTPIEVDWEHYISDVIAGFL